MPPKPPALNQMDQNDADRSEMCGETVVASVMQALGFKFTPEDVINWLRQHYGEAWVVHGTGGESPDHLVAFMVSQGVPAHVVSGQPISEYAPPAEALDKYVLTAIYSDSGGNPDPGHHTGHWILGYAPGQYMNPYGGRYVSYPDLSGEDQNYGIVVDHGIPEEIMWDQNMKRFAAIFIRGKFEAWPASQDAVEFIANKIADDGSNLEQVFTDVITEFTNDKWTNLYDRLARVEGIVSKLSATASTDPTTMLTEINQLQSEMAAIAAAAHG